MSAKIVFASSATNAWGAEQSLWTLAEALKRKGQSVSLLSCDSELVENWSSKLGHAELLPPVPSGIRGLIMWWRHFRRLHGNMWNSETTVVVFSLQLAPLAFALRFLRSRTRPRMILDLHDYLATRKGRWKIRFFAIAFDHVVSVSAFAATQLYSRTPVTVLTRPVAPSTAGAADYEQNAAIHPKIDARWIGVVGRLDPDKNIEFAFDVASEIDHSNSLVLRGSSSSGNEEYGRDLVSKGDKMLGDRFLWQGRIDRDHVMDSLDVLLVVNPYEAMGRTVLEAQLAGVPVVVPDTGGSAELVYHGRTGHTYEAGNAASAAHAIDAAVKNASAVSRQAQREASVTTDPARYAEQYLSAMRP